MANRPVFSPKNTAPFYREEQVEFLFNAGFSASQKQKNVAALHAGYQALYPERRVLEISSKSLLPEGKALSAFKLTQTVPSLGRPVPVECIFQSSKVFTGGGPFTDLLEGSPRDAKKDPRLRESGALTAFRFEGKDYPLVPRSVFYDWLYLGALLENPDLAAPLMEYDAFTDIEFNPAKSVSCQARTAAVYVSLRRQGLLEQVRDFEAYRGMLLPR